MLPRIVAPALLYSIRAKPRNSVSKLPHALIDIAQARRTDDLEAGNGDTLEGNGGKIHGNGRNLNEIGVKNNLNANGIQNNFVGWGTDVYRSASKGVSCWFYNSCDVEIMH
ncbi:hypothetical protein ACOSQ4_017647 [Xanthoceras sorbifolium]